MTAVSGGMNSVSGHVGLGTAGNSASAGSVTVSVYMGGTHLIDTVVTDASGNYATDGLNANEQLAPYAYEVDLHFTYNGSGGYHSAWLGCDALTVAPCNHAVAIGPGISSGVDEVLGIGTGSLTGHVTLGASATSAGAGVVSVTVTGLTNGPTPATEFGTPVTVLTNSSGDYTIPNLLQGSYVLYFSYLGSGPFQSGYYSAYGSVPYLPSASQVPVAVGAPTVEEMGLLDQASLTLHIFLGSTSVSAGAGDVAVQLMWSTSSPADPEVDAVVPQIQTTDASGNVTFTGLLSDVDYHPKFTYSGTGPYAVTSGQGSFRAGYPGWTFTVPVAATLSGHVYLGDSSRSAGLDMVTVTINSATDGYLPPIVVKTDSSGNFSAPRLAVDDYSISLHYSGSGDYPDVSPQSLDGCTWTNCSVELTTGHSAVTITMLAGNEISGSVTADGGAPVANVMIHAERYSENPGAVVDVYDTSTVSDGSYSLRGLPDGDYVVDFVSPGGGYAFQAFDDESIYYYPDLVDVSGGEVASPINAVMHRVSAISGTVSAPGGSAADFAAGDVSAEVEVFDGPTQAWVETADYYPVMASGGAERY
ncbi:MAG: hypothetical protein QOD50_539, partial [Actinomycetota bacterium]|nr:hypothetical protein [Actinomycetota bacterium]